MTGIRVVHVLLLVSMVALTNAICPSTLPKLYNPKTYMCARVYAGSSYLKFFSCRGKHQDIFNGEKQRKLKHWEDRVSSLIVRPGCHLTAYKEERFEGEGRRFSHGSDGNYYLKQSNWATQIKSWKCACAFSNAPLRCTPHDGYRKIVTCHNRKEHGSMECTAKMHVGLETGNPLDGNHFSHRFAKTLRKSRRTGFKWNTRQASVFGEMRKVHAKCNVPARREVEIRQIVGKCGGATTAFTNRWVCVVKKLHK